MIVRRVRDPSILFSLLSFIINYLSSSLYLYLLQFWLAIPSNSFIAPTVHSSGHRKGAEKLQLLRELSVKNEKMEVLV